MERSKFNVDTTSKGVEKRTYEGIVFDSVMEMKFYRDVVLPQTRSGKITKCDLQKEYILQPKFIRNGKTFLPIVYKADFYIEYSDGSFEVIDTKGFADSVAKIKKKMFLYLYPDVPYRWIGYSKIDGNEENQGWVDFDYINRQRAKRKREKRLAKEEKEKYNG